jgi:kynurenine 3-monooxygenase
MTAPVTILGAGCTGPLLATLLARRGLSVQIFEQRGDARRMTLPAGRSINLALAARGVAALERAGLMDAVRPLLVPMRGRIVHDLVGPTRFLPYGQRPHELLWSVSRAGLNRVLTDAAAAHGVEFHFEHAARGADFDTGRLELEDLQSGNRLCIPMEPVIGADGAGSALRRAMVKAGRATAREEPLEHAYKELTIPAGPDGSHLLERGALHIWPRGGYMLIALPNVDGTFTATLFLAAADGPVSFATLTTRGAVGAFFAQEFADVLALVPDLDVQFAANPIGRMSTIHASPWRVGARALLIGDAAHAIVPFHGQGMNCAFEDCRVLDDLLAAGHGWSECFARFDALRREDTAAIARMAVENYVEMRDTVRDPRFALQKELALELERRQPDRFIPRYSMVMFHDEIGYADAERRGAVQSALLDEATRGRADIGEIDLPALEATVIERLPPVTLPAVRT